VHQPIDFEVKGYETFQLIVPITIKENAQPSSDTFACMLTFRGPHGNAFGSLIPLNIAVTAKGFKQEEKSFKSEIERTKLAIKLYEEFSAAEGKSYEDYANIVEQACGNEQVARQMLASKKWAREWSYIYIKFESY